MSQKVNLADAMQKVSGKAASELPDSVPQSVPTVSSSPSIPPSRQGKKAITGFFDPVVSRQLKQIALDEDKTVQALIGEALNDLFVKYNCKPLA